MAEDWDVYFTSRPPPLRSILVDLGLRETAPDAARGTLLRTRIPLLVPREDGLSDESETESLYAIEDALFQELGRGLGARYVGRCTRAGQREFFYYGRGGARFPVALLSVQMKFPQYQFEAETEDDPDWNIYFEQLYPTEIDLLSIQNRRVTEQLADLGDTLLEPRQVTHSMYFATPHSREQFLKTIAAEGFGISLKETEEPDAEYRYGVDLTRQDRVDLNSIDGLVVDLYLRVVQAGGEYEGWDTYPLTGQST
jgi:regulator of RNase E activity RraB